MRIAVLNRDKCQPKECSYQCINFCPRNREGTECIVKGEKGRALIAEELCIGCGICVHKCPLGAIQIINLADELGQEIVHQFGANGFRLYRLPVPREGEVVGLLGPNGIGKTTTISILSGQLVPNMGDYESEPAWGRVLEAYAGTELYNYLAKVEREGIVTAMKPQYVDKLPKVYTGNVGDLLGKFGGNVDEVVHRLELEHSLPHDISRLSGGELQRLAIAATLLKDADIYFFDEPSSYLDIYQRLRIARIIKELAERKQVVVIEHDLAILDFLADQIHLMYGSEAAYGVVAQPRGVKNGINTYLSGFMREENIRFRTKPITFESHPPRKEWQSAPLIEYGRLVKRFEDFELETEPGAIKQGEVVGIVGPNATGKTTFVKILAGVHEPTEGELDISVKVSYKPQYIKPDFQGTVREMFWTVIGPEFDSGLYRSEIESPLNMRPLYEKGVDTLSGGELQRTSIALCLSQDADIYLIDEPSAYLDSNQRMEAAKAIRRVMEQTGKSAMIVDHDVYFIDLVADSIMDFSGDSGKRGRGVGPMGMRLGMNTFLSQVGITFRRDNETRRPRINKPDSRLDREQKSKGEYYYEIIE